MMAQQQEIAAQEVRQEEAGEEQTVQADHLDSYLRHLNVRTLQEDAKNAINRNMLNMHNTHNMQNMTDVQNMTNMSSMIQIVLQQTPPLCVRPSLFYITDCYYVTNMAKNTQNMNPPPL